MPRARVIARVVTTAVAVVALFEGAIAVGWLAPGAANGFGGLLLLIALLGVVVLAVLVPRTNAAAPALLAAAALLVARFLAFDPYYLPGLRRASASWSGAARFRPRGAARLASPLLVFVAVTTLVTDTGH